MGHCAYKSHFRVPLKHEFANSLPLLGLDTSHSCTPVRLAWDPATAIYKPSSHLSPHIPCNDTTHISALEGGIN